MSKPELENLVSQLDELSPSQQLELQRVLSTKLGNETIARDKMTEEEFEQFLVDQGALLDIPPSIVDLAKYQQSTRITIEGEPLSETIISERR